MKTSTTLIALLLLTLIYQTSLASDVTYVDTCGVGSKTNNETMVVTNDIQATNSDDPCITISHEDVTLECDGHLLSGANSGPDLGISIKEVANGVTVRDCKLSGWFLSIVQASHNGLIEDNLITDCGFGIVLEAANGNDIFTNKIGRCSNDAFQLIGANENFFRDNGAYENPVSNGLYLENSHNNDIVDSRFGRNFMGIFLFESNGNNVIDIVSKGHWPSAGIRLEKSHDNLVADSNASRNDIGIEEIGEDLNNIYEDNVCRTNATAASNIENACN